MSVKTEQLTRRDLINPLLGKAGWNLKDRTKVIEEVDTKQSDFKRRDYRTIDETLRNDADSAYVDYLLVDRAGSPLAVVEAKRASKDPVLGQQQAEMYADDIKKQTSQDVFIFLTNGYEIWFWNRPNEAPRMVKGFHSREALERIKFQNVSKKPFYEVPIDPKIVDRTYQIEAVKRVLEGIDRGKRKFLIVHATGTGKTRVAMAIIDVLLRANRAQKILFLADRKALRDQAYNDGFKVFFDEACEDFLRSYLTTRGPVSPLDPLFTSRNGGRLSSYRLGAIVRVTALKAGLITPSERYKVTLHKLRHTYATTLLDQVGIFALKELLGHESIATTERYLHADMAYLKRAYEKGAKALALHMENETGAVR